MLININNCNEYPTIDMDWDEQEDILILHRESEVDDWNHPISINKNIITDLKQPR